MKNMLRHNIHSYRDGKKSILFAIMLVIWFSILFAILFAIMLDSLIAFQFACLFDTTRRVFFVNSVPVMSEKT